MSLNKKEKEKITTLLNFDFMHMIKIHSPANLI